VADYLVEWIEDGDEGALEEARDFALAKIFDRAPLYASLECPPIRKRSRLLRATRAGRLEGLAAVVDDVFPFRSVPLWASFAGAARAMLSRIEAPFTVVAPQPVWQAVSACGSEPTVVEMQMARMLRADAPPPDPRVERLERLEEIAQFLGARLCPVHFEVGPFFGIRDGEDLVACGGVHYVTDHVAQLAYIETREHRRREGFATALTTALIRELETEDRRLVLNVRVDNHAAIELYARLGFRGRARMALFRFDASVR
jgi:ribosomal protein S18 acetylase RimI-like enzyme